MKSHFRPIALICSICVACLVIQAQEENDEDTESSAEQDDAIVLPITVQTTVIDEPPGTEIYSEQIIRNAPVGQRDLADLLQLNTAVDFSRESNLSAGSASLRPAEIAIHGQPYYQNLFLIDGTDTTNDLNPGAKGLSVGGDLFSTPSLVAPIGGSSPQGYYIDTSLLKQVVVYDSNVSAEFGGFTGGVVSAELKEPSDEPYIKLSYGLQLDEWEKYHLTEDDINAADKYRGVYTPDYQKHDLGISVSRKLSENIGIVVGYTRRYSEFLQEYEDDADVINEIYYEDVLDNLVGKVSTFWGESPLSVSFRYSNRSHDGLTSTTYTGLFQKDHEGSGLTASLLPSRFEGRLKLDLSYDRLSDILDSVSNHFVYHEYLEGSGISRFAGAFGDTNQRQARLSFKPTFSFDEWQIGRTTHEINVGGEMRRTESYYERPDTIIYEQYYCIRDNGRMGCRDMDGDGRSSAGDEFLNRRFFYHAGKVELEYQEISAFIEDSIDIGVYELRIGLRGDWGSFLDNFDVSPRVVLVSDVPWFENTTLTYGLSRYYGRSFLRYELNDAIYGWRESYLNLTRPRGRPGEEIPCSISIFENCTHLFYDNRTGAADLKTPYSDEVSIAWAQPILGWNTKTKVIARAGRDGVTRDRIDGLYYYRNNGKSYTRSIGISLDQEVPFKLANSETRFSIGLSYRDSKNNRQSDDAYDESIDNEIIYYKGKLIGFSQLPAWDYNIPYGVRAHAVTTIEKWNIEMMNFFNIKTGGTVARDSREDYTDPVTGLEFDIYADRKFDNLITLDTQIRWSPSIRNDTIDPYLLIKVHNLFDDIVDLSLFDSRRRYTSGRKFSLEVGVTF